jgi:hypothetical protein
MSETTVTVDSVDTEAPTVNFQLQGVVLHGERECVKPIPFASQLGIRPQMVYNYLRKGKLQGVTEPATGKILVDADSARAFATSYLTKKLAKLTEVAE